MLDSSEQQKFDELRQQVVCEKKFACVDCALSDLCEGKYHAELDILECLQKQEVPCKFIRAFGCTFVCTCPLRRFIARNFGRWSAGNTSVLRQTGRG
jgi:hypothetical protein